MRQFLFGHGQGLVKHRGDNRVEGGVQALDALYGLLDQFKRGNFLPSDQFRQPHGVERGIFFKFSHFRFPFFHPTRPVFSRTRSRRKVRREKIFLFASFASLR